MVPLVYRVILRLSQKLAARPSQLTRCFGGGAICARNSMDRRSESAVAPGERAFYAFDHERCCASWEQKPLVPYEHVVVDPLHAALNEIGEALELFREHRDREPVRVTK